MMKSLRICFIFSYCYLLFFSSHAQKLDSTMWTTNGTVWTMEAHNNTIYVGGVFTYVGPNNGSAVPLDLNTGKPTTKFPRVDGKVSAVIADGKGGWFIGGNFERVAGIERKSIAHIHADYSLDMTWEAQVDYIYPDQFSGVKTLALEEDILYIGGAFTYVNREERNHLASVNATTGVIKDWNPNPDFEILSLATSGNIVYVLGGFHKIGSYDRQGLAAIDVITGIPTSWNPVVEGGKVNSISVANNLVYIAGRFSTVNNQPRYNLAAIDAITGLTTDLQPYIDDNISTMLLADNVIYIGGNFTQVGGQQRKYIASLDASTGIATNWNPDLSNIVNNFDYNVNALAVTDQEVYISGYHDALNPSIENNYAYCVTSINKTTGALNWQTQAGKAINALAISAENLYAGGDFSSIGGQDRNSIAAINATTGDLISWIPFIDRNQIVNDIAITGNTIYIGGRFKRINTVERNAIGAIDITTGLLTNWNPNAALENDTLNIPEIYALSISNNIVYAGGIFTRIGNQQRNNLAAIDMVTGLATNWNPIIHHNGLSPGIHALAVSGNHLYIGGSFTDINGQTRNGLGSINTETGLVTAWNPILSEESVVTELLIADEKLFASGYFNCLVGDENANSFIAFDLNTGIATYWNRNIGFEYDTRIHAIAVNKGIVYIGGYFSSIQNQPRNHVAALDASTGELLNWNTSFISNNEFKSILAICVTEKGILIGGDFNKIAEAKLEGGLVGYDGKAKLPTNSISGSIFLDDNTNCIKEDTEIGVKNYVVVAEPGHYFTTTDSTGNYTLKVPDGDFTIKQIIPAIKSDIVKQICPTSTAHSVSFNGTQQDIEGINFGNQIVYKSYLNVNITSAIRRRCFRGTTRINYNNEGNVSVSNVQVKVIMPPYVVPISSSMAWTSRKDSVLTFTIGTLAAGARGYITIVDSVICGNESIRGLTQCTKAIITPPNTDHIDSRWDQSSITLNAICKDNGFVKLSIKNTGLGHMADSSSYRIYLDAVQIFTAHYKLRSSDSLLLEVPANGKTVRLEADLRPYHPGAGKPSVTIEGCGGSKNVAISKGFVDVLPQDDAEEEVEISCMPIVDSNDPNDKQVSPAGVTASHIIDENQDLEYVIRFQNTGTDVAYNISIIDTLNENLDITTLQISESSHISTWKVSGEGKPVLTWIFNNINLPDSTHNEKESHGFVSFKIKQIEGNPDGTIISNKAHIYFDFNSAVITNETTNTVGEIPVSAERIIVNTCGIDHPSKAEAGSDIIVSIINTTSLQATPATKGIGRWKVVKGNVQIINAGDPATSITNIGDGQHILEWSVTLCEEVTRDSIKIERSLIPPMPVAISPAPHCQGDKIQALTATGNTITWYADAILKNKLAEGHTYLPAITQTDTFFVTQKVNGYESKPTEVIVVIKPKPTMPTVQFSDKLYCNPIDIEPIVALGDNIKWYTDVSLNNKVFEGNSYKPVITVTDTFYVTQSINACESQAEKVIVRIQPSTIEITTLGDTLLAPQAEKYQWHFEGEPILNATRQMYIAQLHGHYTVAVTNESCTIISKEMHHRVQLKQSILKIFPNPSPGDANIELTTNDTGTVQISLINALGVIVQEITLEKSNLMLTHTLNINPLPKGMYYIAIRTAAGTTFTKLVKN